MNLWSSGLVVVLSSPDLGAPPRLHPIDNVIVEEVSSHHRGECSSQYWDIKVVDYRGMCI